MMESERPDHQVPNEPDRPSRKDGRPGGPEGNHGQGSGAGFQENIDLLRTILDNTPLAVVMVDRDGVVRMINDAAAVFAGREAESMIGRPGGDAFRCLHSLDDPKGCGFGPSCEICIIRTTVMDTFATGKGRRGVEGKKEFYHGEVSEELYLLLSTALVEFDSKHWVQLTIEDVTERKRMEEILRREKDFAERLVETAQAIVLVLDTEGRIVRFNPYMEILSGYSLDEVRGKDWFSVFLPEEDRDRIRELFVKAVGDIQTRANVNSIVTRDGEKREIEWYDKTLKDREGKVIGLLAVGQDITERKKGEEKLRESLQTSEDIVQTIPAGMFIYQFEEPDRLVLVAGNAESERLTGIAARDWKGREFNEIWPQARERGITEAYLDVMRTGITFGTEDLYYEDQRLSGAFRIRAFRIPKDRLVVAFENVTESKRAEEAIRENEEKFRSLASLSPTGIYLTDEKGSCQYVNERWCEMAGITSQEALGDGWVKAIHPDDREVISRSWNRMVESEGKWGREYRFMTPGGRISWVFGLAVPVRDSSGKLTGYIGTNLDITDRKRAEEALRQSEENHRTMVENLGEGVGIMDLDENFIFANPTAHRILGADQGTLPRRNLKDFLNEESFSQVRSQTQRRKTGRTSNYELEIIRHDGERRNLLVTAAPKFDGNREVCGSIGMFVDVTERKKAEEALKREKARFEQLFESAHEGIEMSASDGTILHANREFLRIFGFTLDEVVGRNIDELVAAGDMDNGASITKDVAKGENVAFEAVRWRKDGTPVHVSVLASSIIVGGEQVGVFGIYRDITERKKAEETLRQSKENYSAVVEGGSDAIIIHKEGTIVFANTAAGLIMDLDTRELVGRSIMEFITPEDQKLVAKRYAERVAGKNVPTIYEVHLQRRDSSVLPVEINVSIIDYEGENAALVFLRDVTERKEAEKALRESEEKFSNLFHNSNAGIILHDLKGKVLDCNQRAQELFGFTRDEFLSLSTTQLYNPELADSVKEGFRILLKEKHTSAETELRKKNGEFFSADVSSSLFEIGRILVIQRIIRDITERKRVETWITRLNQLKEKLLSSAGIGDKLRSITGELVSTFDADFARIWMIRPGDTCDAGCVHARVTEGPHVCRHRDRCLHLIASSGRYTHTDGEVHRRVPFGCYKIGRVAAGKDKKFVTNDVTSDPRVHDHDWARKLGLVSFAGYRLLSEEGVVMGVMALFKRQSIGPEEDAFLEGIANTTAQVIQATQAEEALRESEEFNKAIVDHSPIGISVRKRTGQLLGANETWRGIWAYGKAEVEEDIHRERAKLRFDEKDGYLGEWQSEVKRIYEQGGNLYVPELKIPNPREGGAHWVSQYFYSIRDKQGKVDRVVILSEDITERKLAEVALEKSQANLKRALGLSKIGTFSWDLEKDKMEWSDELFDIMGRNKEDGVPEIDREGKMTHPDDREHFVTVLKQAFAEGGPYTVDYRVFRYDDHDIRFVHVEADVGHRDGNPIMAYGMVQDVTEQKRLEGERRGLEVQLRQKKKLESIGTLASGVAHEINNPLTGIIGYAQLIHDRVKDEELREFSGGIVEEGNRVATIVKSLLAFSRQEQRTHSPTSLKDIMDSSLTLVGTLLRKDEIILEIGIPGGLPRVRCQKQQIQQVMINLITNSRDALNHRYPGKNEDKLLRISARPFEKEGVRWVRTTVEDHGIGIPEENLDKVFDPFFTTKSRDFSSGKFGTGLGLAVSYGIIEEHRGEISVESGGDRYTRFHVDLPVNEEEMVVEPGMNNDHGKKGKEVP